MSPGRSRSPPWRARNAARPVPARKHRSCESALLRDRQPGLRGDRAHLRLAQLAEREPQPRDRVGPQRGEHVRLVLGGVDRRAQQAVVARRARSARSPARRRRGASARSSIASRRTWPLQRMHGFGVRPSRVLGQVRVDDAGAERVAQVEREVRQAHAVGEHPRVPHRAGRAAAALGVVLGVAPQLERHARDVRARRARTSSAATAESTPPEVATSTRSPVGHARRRARRPRPAPVPARRRPARRRGACPAHSPPSSAAMSRGAHARGVEHRRAADELDDRASRRRSTAPQPLASKPASTTRAALDAHADADQVAARRAAGRAVGARRRGLVRRGRAGAAGAPRTARRPSPTRLRGCATRYVRSTYRGSVNVGYVFGLRADLAHARREAVRRRPAASAARRRVTLNVPSLLGLDALDERPQRLHDTRRLDLDRAAPATRAAA